MSDTITYPTYPRFNEAGALTPRKEARPHLLALPRARFNEAGALTPRKVG